MATSVAVGSAGYTFQNSRSPGIRVASNSADADGVHTRNPEAPYLDLHKLEVSESRGESRSEFEGIVGSSNALREVLNQVLVVAPTDAAVLIEGETGTGKEVIASAIHASSNRRDRPFVKLNCAAIPATLLESELFGHEKGAFTDAIKRKAGRFEEANSGTIFLDEIGDLPLELQPKLLRVLQEKEFERLGSACTHRVDVRVVAATNRNLAALVAQKRFRMDLYYRLNVFPIALPPLRLRRQDIPLFVAYFVRKFGERMSKQISKISKSAMDELVGYSWAGNIRELQNIIERAVILTDGDVLEVAPLSPDAMVNSEPPNLRPNFMEKERNQILRALEESNWVVGGTSGAAARLGVPRTTLISKMRKSGIASEMARTQVAI